MQEMQEIQESNTLQLTDSAQQLHCLSTANSPWDAVEDHGELATPPDRGLQA